MPRSGIMAGRWGTQPTASYIWLLVALLNGANAVQSHTRGAYNSEHRTPEWRFPTWHASDEVLATSSHEVSSERRKLAAVGDGFWSTSGTKIVDAGGNEVYFSGVNWNGFEGSNCVVDGLFGGLNRTYASHLEQMASLNFNVIRLAFAGACMSSGTIPDSAIDFDVNPDLLGLTPLQVMQKIVSAAQSYGIRIILDYHRMAPTDPKTYASEPGLWFDSENPIDLWFSNWKLMATTFKGQTAVVGVDLFNEPHVYNGVANGRDTHPGPVWDDSDATYNWKAAAFHAASVIQSIEPGWLICVEGLWQGTFWGGDLREVQNYPLKLDVSDKLVYEVHDYGPLVFDAPWLHTDTFEANLTTFWEDAWGFVTTNGIAPVFVGEFGSIHNLTNTSAINLRENQWFSAVIKYIGAKELSWTVFTWGPNSVDTGGILLDDWLMTDEIKLLALDPIMHPNFGRDNSISTPIASLTLLPPSTSRSIREQAMMGFTCLSIFLAFITYL